MSEQSICAVIVTYHPTPRMVENIFRVLTQVQGLVVIDNGSDFAELSLLRTASHSSGFHLIENGENLGIAEALNQGIRWAKSESYPWVILFDQDSVITDGFVGQMFTAWESHPECKRICAMHPKYIDPETGTEAAVWRAGDGTPVVGMTSGALMPMWIFDKIGWYASEFFIDEVDREYCYRIRAAGYLIADNREAVLLHSAGHPKRRTILGFSFNPSNHSTTRRYYITRNRLVVYRKYFLKFPRWILQTMYASFRETVKCFIGEQNRARKFRNFLLGTADALRGKMGKREGLE